MERPLLIDEADGPCEICAEWVQCKGKCKACGEVLALYLNMHGNGYDSVKPHHFHLRGIGPGGVPGRASVHQELCLECYRKSFQKAYPNAEVPV